MAYFRIKSIKTSNGRRYCYAYLVKNVWDKKKKSPRQKVVAYIGKVRGLESYQAKEIFERDGFQCQSRDCFMQSNLTVDHKIPLNKGGTNDPENLQVLCEKCNQKKGQRTDWPVKEKE